MPKPKGMWWKTYYRLQRRAQAAENRAADDFIIAAGRLVKVGESELKQLEGRLLDAGLMPDN